jgi:hypothetical protein
MCTASPTHCVQGASDGMVCCEQGMSLPIKLRLSIGESLSGSLYQMQYLFFFKFKYKCGISTAQLTPVVAYRPSSRNWPVEDDYDSGLL